RHLQMQRLRHVIVGAVIERPGDEVVLAGFGHHDDRQLVGTQRAAHAIEHLEPGHLRHADIEHHQVEALRFQEIERRMSTSRGRDGITRLTQLLSELCQSGNIVIHAKDMRDAHALVPTGTRSDMTPESEAYSFDRIIYAIRTKFLIY